MVERVVVDRRDEHGPTLDRIRSTYAAYAKRGRYRLWDIANPGFARISSDRSRLVASLLRRSVSVAASPSILDLGCGSGGTAHLVADAVPGATYVGVDLIPELVEQARRRNPSVRFEVASAHDLPFADGEFDAVLAMTLFSSLPRISLERAVAAEIARVLRDRGWLLWYDLRYRSPGNPLVHALPAERVRSLFPGWPAELHTVTLVPPVARRLGPTTPVVYPLLHLVPALRSHLVGRLQRPPR